MSLVSRLIKTLSDAIECESGTTERLSTFVSRFWGLASTHLMHAQASQDSQLGEMLAIVHISNSTLDANTLASAKLELIRAAEVRSLDQNKAVSESPFKHSRRRSEIMETFIVKILKVSKFLKKFVNAVRSLTRQNSLPSSAKRVVEKICDKASAKLEEADKESLICLDALAVQDYQPRICFRLDDAVTVLKTIDHVDNQQLGNFSQRGMENIVNAKVQKLEAAFTAQMQTLLATQQKTAQNFTTAPSADDKRTAAQVEEAKGSKKREIRRHRSDFCGDCGLVITRGAQMLVLIQALMRVRSKNEGRMKSLLIQMPKGILGPSISGRVFETAGAVGSSA
jgi:hypothetical protein